MMTKRLRRRPNARRAPRASRRMGWSESPGYRRRSVPERHRHSSPRRLVKASHQSRPDLRQHPRCRSQFRQHCSHRRNPHHQHRQHHRPSLHRQRQRRRPRRPSQFRHRRPDLQQRRSCHGHRCPRADRPRRRPRAPPVPRLRSGGRSRGRLGLSRCARPRLLGLWLLLCRGRRCGRRRGRGGLGSGLSSWGVRPRGLVRWWLVCGCGLGSRLRGGGGLWRRCVCRAGFRVVRR